MPWALTTPIQTGDIDPAGPYSQIKVTGMKHDSNRGIIVVNLEYGNTVDGSWVQGKNPIGLPVRVTIDDSDYITLVTTHTSQDGELTYTAVKRGLYEWLNANSYIAAGTIV